MANGAPFNPDRLTAASWFYPLGTKVMVRHFNSTNSVLVTITDRGPAKRLVANGRIIDLGQAAFRKLASSQVGLVPVQVEVVELPAGRPGKDGASKKDAPTGRAQSTHG